MCRLAKTVLVVLFALSTAACENFLRSVIGGNGSCSIEEIGIVSPSSSDLPFVGADQLCAYKTLFANDFLGGTYLKSALLAETVPSRGSKLIITDGAGNFILKYRIAVSMSGAPSGTTSSVVSVWTSSNGYSLGEEIGSAIVHNGEVVVLTNNREKAVNSLFIHSLIVKAVYERPAIGWETARVLVESRTSFLVRIG